ncbi:hypothetical protein CDD83_5564 [Cordyceps sp. RAO-2017]|nr:hypothetical protein CDD83_5564 [Cordyceps sp. RAO-2017]
MPGLDDGPATTSGLRIFGAGEGLQSTLDQGFHAADVASSQKITEKIAALPHDADFFSLEFFPPKTKNGTANLRARIVRMKHALQPLFVSITWGAGGSSFNQSFDLAEKCQRELGLTTLLHLTTVDMTRQTLDRALARARALGIRNIMALKGDRPRDGSDPAAGHAANDAAVRQDFFWAVDLVRYIRKAHGNYFNIGVAAYPEGHFNASDPSSRGVEHDLPFLAEKVEAGADFIMTQLFYDMDAYADFESKVRAYPSEALKKIPIIPGILPIPSQRRFDNTLKLAHATVPDIIRAQLDPVRKNNTEWMTAGERVVTDLVGAIHERASKRPGPRGYSFFTLNQEEPVSTVLKNTHLASGARKSGASDA